MSLSRVAYKCRTSLSKSSRQFLARRCLQPGRQVGGDRQFNHGNVMDFGEWGMGFLFGCGFIGGTFTGAAVWEYESSGEWRKSLATKTKKFLASMGVIPTEDLTTQSAWQDIVTQWCEQSGGDRMLGTIVAANTAVWCAWTYPSLERMLMQYFMCSTTKNSLFSSLVLSMFSHQNPVHLAANMFALYNLVPVLVLLLGKEQFLALYLSSGVFASVVSQLFHLLRSRPSHELGASGAITGIATYTCCLNPNNATALIFMVAPEIVGALIQSPSGGAGIGHVAHLGGALFGLLYYLYGQRYYYIWRKKVITTWRDIRAFNKNTTGNYSRKFY